MIRFDPSAWLLFAVPFVAVTIFITRRGLLKNQFRVRGGWGWATYATWSVNWWLATLTNLTFVGASLFIFYMSLFHGTDFSREPAHPMPTLAGKLIKEVQIQRSPQSLADCLSNLDFGQIYHLAPDHWRVAVRDSRNGVRAIFEIVPDRAGSRLGVYDVGGVAFVSWSRCFDSNDDGSDSSPWLKYQGGH